MARLSLTLLGGFEARLGPGVAVALPTRKTQALLAYLALTPGQSHPRDKLAALLWGDVPREQARKSLRQTLFGLRKALHASESGTFGFEGEEVALDRSTVEVDVVGFERLVAQGTPHAFAQAAALYRGDLLEGLALNEAGFEGWLMAERERLRELAVEALAKLLGHQRSADTTDAAVQTALQLLALDPLQEAAHRTLMRLYVRQGRRGAALRHYQHCVGVLQRELGVEPENATKELYQEILRQRPFSTLGADAGPPGEPTRPVPELPAPALPIIGRTREIEAVRSMLLTPTVRLLTFVGPPGVGKTRLALQMAWETHASFPDGARFIELAAIRDPALVVPAIRQALKVSESGSGGPQAEAGDVHDHLRGKSILLVLDNFEQVLSAAPTVAELLTAGPSVKILVTSRAPLHVYGEHQFPVEPLALPDLALLPSADDLLQLPSVALFVARAQAVRPEFALTAANASTVAALCVRLDGLPLAIELAAPQIKQFSLVELAVHLAQPLDALTDGAQNLPARQRTLRRAIEWSYGLLEPREQRWFARLGVFAGGFDAEAAQAVCADGESATGGRELDSLLDRSLIQPAKAAGERSRFMLLETLRQYALDRLVASGEEPATRRRHAAYFLGLSEDIAPHLTTSRQRHCFERLDGEHDNFRSALAWLLDSPPGAMAMSDAERAWRAETALRMAVNLFRFWRYRCYLSEGHRWTTAVLASDGGRDSPSSTKLRAEAYWDLAMFSGMLSLDGEAREQLAESLRLSQATDDTPAIAKALTGLGWLASNQGETARAIEMQTRAVELLESAGADFSLTYAYNALGATLRSADANQQAKRCLELCLDVCRRIDNARGAAVALVNLGGIHLDAGRMVEAFEAFRDALDEFVQIDDRVNIAASLIGIVGTLADGDAATQLLGFADHLLQTTGGQLQKADQRIHDREVERRRAVLASAQFDASWLKGGALSLEQAIEMAVPAVGDPRLAEVAAAQPQPDILVVGTPLIGRDMELARLASALEDAWAGRGQCLAIIGETGVGKSQLLTAVGADAARRGGRVLVGRCYESDQILPFGPWVDAFRGALVTRDAEALRNLPGVWRSELARLLPEVGTPPAGTGDHLRLFESVAQFLNELSTRQPLALMLEDLHWADEMSLRLFAFLARRLETQRLLVLGTAREEDLADAPVLCRTLEDLTREGRLIRLAVAPLSRADTGNLVRALARAGSDEATLVRLGEQVWQASEGNPFVVVEHMRALEQGAPPETPSGLPLPERVSQLVGRRLDRLSERSREVATIAAVIGREFDFALLQRAAALDERATAEALEELVRRRILLYGLAGRFYFTHESIRAVIDGQVLAPRRKLHHRQVAEALEAVHAPDLEPHALALGRHYAEGEVWDKAVSYFRRAATQAVGRSANREAAASYEQALNALGHVPAGRETTAQAIDLRMEMQRALIPLGEAQRTLANLLEAEASARAIGDQARLGRAAASLTNYFWRTGDSSRAAEWGERARALAGTIGDRMLATLVDLSLGQVYQSRGEYGRAITVLSHALEDLRVDSPGERFGMPGLASVLARGWVCWSLSAIGEFAKGIALGEEAVRIAETADDAFSRANAYRELGCVYLRKGDLAPAVEMLERGLELCRREDLAMWFPATASALGYACALQGRLDRAVPLLEEALERSPSLGIMAGQGVRMAWLAEAYLLAGRLDDALALATSALDLSRQRGERGNEARIVWLLGEVACRRNPPAFDEAFDSYRRALALTEELGLRPQSARCHLSLGILHHRKERPGPAREALLRATEMFRAMGMTFWLSRAEAELVG